MQHTLMQRFVICFYCCSFSPVLIFTAKYHTHFFQTPVTYDIIKMRGAVSEERQYIAVLHYGEETYRGEGSSEMYAKYRAAHMAIKALDRTGNTHMQSFANRCSFSPVLHVIQHRGQGFSHCVTTFREYPI